MTAPAKTIPELYSNYLHAHDNTYLPGAVRCMDEDLDALENALGAADALIDALQKSGALPLRIVRTVR